MVQNSHNKKNIHKSLDPLHLLDEFQVEQIQKPTLT